MRQIAYLSSDCSNSILHDAPSLCPVAVSWHVDVHIYIAFTDVILIVRDGASHYNMTILFIIWCSVLVETETLHASVQRFESDVNDVKNVCHVIAVLKVFQTKFGWSFV